MCNHYRLNALRADIAKALDVSVIQPVQWKDEIYPRGTAPVIISHEGRRKGGPMSWGVPTTIEGRKKHVTNARNLSSSFWKGMASRPLNRCLVPFTSFAEPAPGKDENGRPAEHWFTVTDQPIPCFAGLWRKVNDEHVFAFCTTEPNPLVAPHHPKAMPVILLADDQERWLTGTYEDALQLQAAYPSQMMEIKI
ncbi:MAG: DUF159 family protein [Sphingobium sp.]|nr:DUF159 family protein [Sphingobium sp.]